jgi:hypothetical protein
MREKEGGRKEGEERDRERASISDVMLVEDFVCLFPYGQHLELSFFTISIS